MSEFKYACPVCGQHIKVDSSQAGTQMQCPTCFQKIIVPQAPVGEQTLILTGAKVGGERPKATVPEASPFSFRPAKGFPGVAVVLIILACIAVAVGFVYRGTIFKTSPSPAATNTVSAAPKKAPPRPALIAPQANDTNWILDLKGAAIPPGAAAGRIDGQNFISPRATLANGFLTFRDGDLSLGINLAGAAPESLAGKTLDISTNAPAAARVILRWKSGDQTMHETFTNGYAMLLTFGPLMNNRMEGKIYLCTADEKMSYLAGTFRAEIRKPKPKRQ